MLYQVILLEEVSLSQLELTSLLVVYLAFLPFQTQKIQAAFQNHVLH